MVKMLYYCYNTGDIMKNILIILGILVFINILIVTVSKVFAQEAGINYSAVKIFQVQSI